MTDYSYKGEWISFVCSDCNPEYEGEDAEYKTEFVLLVRAEEEDHVPDICPRCESYMGLSKEHEGLLIDFNSTPEGRYAKKQAEKEQTSES